MLEILNLKGEERLKLGKEASKAVKLQNKIPAIIYGKGQQNIAISLDAKSFEQEHKKEGFMSHIFDITVNKNKYRAIPKEVQLDPVTDRVVHVDFMHINEADDIKLSVPLHFLNKEKCVGIKKGGVLNIIKYEIEVLCKINNIPKSIDIDLTSIDIGGTLHVQDIKFPKDVQHTYHENLTVLTIVGKGQQKEETTEESEEQAKE